MALLSVNSGKIGGRDVIMRATSITAFIRSEW
jgi:hypothetical protein